VISLHLQNFKQHKDSKYELPDIGLIRITGNSGAGKSTICLAIEYALWGISRGVRPWSKESPTSVTMSGLCGIDITRTTAPNTLTVTKEGIEYLDDAGQGVIDSVLGMDYMEFMVSSYNKPEASNSILNQDPAQIMKIIQDLSSKGVKIDELKININTKIAMKKTEVKIAQNDFDNATKTVDQLKSTIASIQAPIEPEDKFKDISREEVRSKILNLTQEQTENNRIRDLIRSKNEKLESINTRLRKVESDISSFKLEQCEEPWKLLSKEETDEKKKLLIEKSEYINKFNKLVSLATDVHARYQEAKSWTGKLSDWIKEKLTAIGKAEAEAVRLNTEYLSKIETLNKWDKNTTPCPECKCDLKIVGNTLVHASKKPPEADEMIQELYKAIEQIMGEIEVLATDKSYLNEVLNKAEFIKNGLGKDPAPQYKNAKEISEEVEKLNAYILKQNELSSKKVLQDHTVNSMNKQLKELTEERAIADAIAIGKEVVEDKFFVDAIERLREMDIAMMSHEKDVASYNSAKKSYESLRNHLDKVKKELEVASTAFERISQEAAAAEILKERIYFAAAAAVDHKVSEMNKAAEIHIDKMFSEDGTSIRLSTTSITSAGDERATVSIDITHKGEKVKKISEFSTGEKSRACLAYQLGMSDLYRSPILMIDEGLTGLPEDKKEECMDALRDASENRLVIIVEHGFRDSFFDQVIEV